MTRIRGMHLLAGSFVLWALAVWVFGTPHPAATETAATETPPPVAVEATPETGTVASEAAVPAPAAPSRETVVAVAPGTTAGASSATATSGHAGTAAPAAAPSVVETPAPPAAEAPGTAPGDRSSNAQAAGAGSMPVRPPPPGTAAPGSGGDPGGTESPRPPAPAYSWYESAPPPHRPPPSPPRYPAVAAGAVTGQLNAARRAAWEGRYADSVAHYRAAARLRPADHVVWGEMGNVLWTMRRWPEAAYALEGAATLLVRAGELRAASELVPAVGRIDRQAAYRIDRLLWEAAQRRPG